MKFEEHCKRSMDLFGEDGAEYHRWLDQYACFGVDQRRILHNADGVFLAVIKFGEKARKHIMQHLRDDGINIDLEMLRVRKDERKETS